MAAARRTSSTSTAWASTSRAGSSSCGIRIRIRTAVTRSSRPSGAAPWARSSIPIPRKTAAGWASVYPDGPWGPDSHIQWGAILYDWLGQGEPFTFHWKQQPDGSWTEGPVRDKQLPKIPSMPLSERNAAEILKHLGGARAPEDWQGGLPITYRIGPGPVDRRDGRAERRARRRQMRSVIGVIRGSEEPEKLVILGNHLDAWIYGAVDPSSGTAAILETARALGQAVKKGHRPRRTIVFAVWDGEEPLLGGSTQWALDNAEDLRRNAVTYINVDTGVQGGEFVGGATPALAEFLRDVTKAVQDPVSGKSFYEGWAARSTARCRASKRSSVPPTTPRTRSTSASPASTCISTAHTAFITHVRQLLPPEHNGRSGIQDRRRPVAALGRARLAARECRAPADALLAIRARRGRLHRIGRAARRRGEAAPTHGGTRSGRPLGGSGDRVRAAARRGSVEPATARAVNDRLMQVERALVEPTGQKGRPFIRHLLVAPQPSYRSAYLPRIWDALDRDDRAAIPGHEAEIVAAFDRAASILREATNLLH